MKKKKKKNMLGIITLLKKYNTTKLELKVTEKKLEDKILELGVQRRIHKKMKEVWEQKLKEQEEEIIKLKREKINDSNSKKSKCNNSKTI